MPPESPLGKSAKASVGSDAVESTQDPLNSGGKYSPFDLELFLDCGNGQAMRLEAALRKTTPRPQTWLSSSRLALRHARSSHMLLLRIHRIRTSTTQKSGRIQKKKPPNGTLYYNGANLFFGSSEGSEQKVPELRGSWLSETLRPGC